ncbi:MAG: TAT-variant-translocated molybdopterin oxidoreductase [Planctomycetota bacterium]
MPSLDDVQGASPEGRTYWRSLNELADTPEFREMVQNEFPSQLDAVVDPLSRRRFVQLMGASLALAGLTGCDALRWPEQRILPYSRLPDERLPGKPVHYATCMELGGVAHGLLVRSYDGRPIKVEGNEAHPESLGGTTGYAQASVLGLYDPDRSNAVRRKGVAEASSWEAFQQELAQQLSAAAADKGAKLAILSEATSSPTIERLREQLRARLPLVTWWEHEPVSRQNEVSGLAAQLLSGRYRVQLDLRGADVILSLDDDLLGDHPAALRLSREWADRRRETDQPHRPDGPSQGNRLYVVEGTFSLTGGMADVRYPLQAGQLLHFGLHLAGNLAAREELKGKTSEELRKLLASFVDAKAPYAELVEQVAQDLLAARGRGVIAVGPRQPSELVAVAHLLNGLLENVGPGHPVNYTPAPEAGAGDLAKLREEINAGKVETLIVIGANPAYTAPVNLDFGRAIEKVKWSAHLGLYHDETGRLTTWHLPRAHYLEAWGDARSYDGTTTLCQPLIAPLYAGRTAVELLGMLVDPAAAPNGYEAVRATQRAKLGADFERGWRRALHDGVVPGSAAAFTDPGQIKRQDGPLLEKLQKVPPRPSANEQALELVFVPCRKVYDGRFANNGWLQELPDPLTKLTWDNAVLLSPETAAKLGGVKEGDLVELTVKVAGTPKPLEVAAYVLPGLPDFTLTLALGYGRGEACGVVGAKAGFNAYALRGTDGLDVVGGVTLKRTGKTYKLSTTQDHHSVRTPISDAERDRRAADLVREGTLAQFRRDRKFAKETWQGGQYGAGPDPATTQLWKEPQAFEGRRWGMSIDLSVCTGCSACVVACQSENNIPIVGKQEVARGREMHWLRIDRYFAQEPLTGHVHEHGAPVPERAGARELPAFLRAVRVVHQPMPCQQCENAPCESVCPVAATTHSAEGLNDMVYNRCVGTRYCSNNCPWKVRRFNYFWNHHGPFHPRSAPGPSELPKLPKSPLSDALKVLPTAAETSKVEQMAFNPEVTVRARGVMEKCTYCVQRIKAVSIPARSAAVRAGQKEWKVEDGAIQTACQQACPTRAIVFGDLSDPESAVSRLKQNDRDYVQLAELNARPRTSYLAKIRNLPSV